MGRFILGIYGLMVGFLIPGPVRGDIGTTGHARLALSGPAHFTGETVSKDFLVRLPAHVNPQAGSQLTLSLRTQPTLLALVAAIEVHVNGQAVSTMSLDRKNPSEATNSPLRVVATIPPRHLQSGGNRFTLNFQFRKMAEANHDVLKTTSWVFEPSNSFFALIYERAEIFPEMRRFPESLAEEKLLQSDSTESPLLTLFLPTRQRDAHLRACAVVAARLGQLGYFTDRDCRLITLERWQAESETRSGLIVACRDELGSIVLPSHVTARLKDLGAGQGLLAEFIVGERGRQRRWMLASGADDLGLERAVITVGHSSAMAVLPSNPAIIETEPVFEPDRKAPQQNHSSLWTQCQSFLTSAATRITGAIYGSESKDAKIAQPPTNGKISGLHQLQQILIKDSTLQQTAFLMSKSASLGEVKLMFDLALYLGGQLPTSAVLWPEACIFSRSSPPPQARLQGRTVLLLGTVAEWGNAFSTPLPLEIPGHEIGRVRIQGRPYTMAAFEPTLGFVHLLPSPWSKGEHVIAAGGWQDVSAPAVKGLFELAAPAGKLGGNLCASDTRGRIAVYDTRHPKLESFVQILQKNIPEGLTENETVRQLESGKLRATHSASLNRMISCVIGGWLLLLVAARLLLLWDREWRRRRTLRDEKLLPGPNANLELTNVQ